MVQFTAGNLTASQGSKMANHNQHWFNSPVQAAPALPQTVAPPGGDPSSQRTNQDAVWGECETGISKGGAFPDTRPPQGEVLRDGVGHEWWL